MRMRRLTVVVVRVVCSRLRNYKLARTVSAPIVPTAGCIGLNGRAITRVILVWTWHRELMTVVKILLMAIATLHITLVYHSMLPIHRMLRICLLRSKQKPETNYRQTQNAFHRTSFQTNATVNAGRELLLTTFLNNPAQFMPIPRIVN